MTQQSRSTLKIVFGAMTFGREGAEQARVHKIEDCSQILNVFQSYGHDEVDTARTYGGGSSEEYLGQLEWQQRGIIMDTKLSPISLSPTGFNPTGSEKKVHDHSPAGLRTGLLEKVYNHSPAGLRTGLLESLKALKTNQIDLWYLHAPDRNTPYEDTLREVNNMYNEGYFRRFGISNYPAEEVSQISEICIRNGWKKPDVYQGIYNALHRAVEPELFPCLRKYGIAFYEYNPLAGGLLTDRYRRDMVEHEDGSRYDPNKTQGAFYRGRYWNDAYFDALDIVRLTAKKLGLTTAEVALRWVNHHSLMKKEYGDAIITSASNAAQLEENLKNLEKGPLPEEMLMAIDTAWSGVQGIYSSYAY